MVRSVSGYHRTVSTTQQPSSPRDWVREAIRIRGVLGALRYYAVGSFELLRDLTPRRRRSRYGDIDFDFDQWCRYDVGHCFPAYAHSRTSVRRTISAVGT